MFPSRWTRFLPLLALSGLLGVLILAVHHHHGTANKFALHVGEAAPDTDLPPLMMTSAGYSKKARLGHPYLVNFFASWCGACHGEHPGLLLLADNFQIPVIGIAHKDKPELIAAYLKRDGNPFDSIADDGAGRAGIDWGITGLPETYVIDAEGIIRLHIVGPVTDDILHDQILPLWKTLDIPPVQ